MKVRRVYGASKLPPCPKNEQKPNRLKNQQLFLDPLTEGRTKDKQLPPRLERGPDADHHSFP